METFILKATKTFRQAITIFIKSADGKVDKRQVEFTTEHKVRETDRMTNARKVHAEFSTSDKVLIDAMYRDTGYSITFVHKDDPRGERKRTPFNVTPLDAKLTALRNLFLHAGLEFDAKKDINVLNEEYQFHMAAKTGIDASKSTATVIPETPVDVQAQINTAISTAREKYEKETGEPFPEFENRSDLLTFVDGLNAENFDVKSFIENKAVKAEDGLPDNLEDLHVLYQQVLKVQVPNPKKNDADWIKKKIEEANGLQ